MASRYCIASPQHSTYTSSEHMCTHLSADRLCAYVNPVQCCYISVVCVEVHSVLSDGAEVLVARCGAGVCLVRVCDTLCVRVEGERLLARVCLLCAERLEGSVVVVIDEPGPGMN